MKDKIQQLIQWAEVRKKAFSAMANMMQTDRVKYKAIGRVEENAFFIEQLTLLLNDESNQPQPPDFANTMLGEVPPVGHSNISESSQAVEGETRLVGQNEQTKKGCRFCGRPCIVDGGICYDCHLHTR